MDATALLMDAAHRPVETARAVLDGISDEALHAMPGGHGNSIAWLIWHAARQWDYQLAELAGEDQVWVTGEWGGRLGIDRGAKEIGFGDSPDDVARLLLTATPAGHIGVGDAGPDDGGGVGVGDGDRFTGGAAEPGLTSAGCNDHAKHLLYVVQVTCCVVVIYWRDPL